VWDGKYGQKEVAPGVYIYSVQVRHMVEGEEVVEVFNGDVTVVR
jgi:hypothetical protein